MLFLDLRTESVVRTVFIGDDGVLCNDNGVEKRGSNTFSNFRDVFAPRAYKHWHTLTDLSSTLTLEPI